MALIVGEEAQKVDHRTAAGEFGTLLSLRAAHFSGDKDGIVTSEEAARYREQVKGFKSKCVGPGVRVGIFGGIGSGAFVTAERASFLVQERSINFDWTGAQRLLHQAESIADQAAEWWPWHQIEDSDSDRDRRRQEAADQERRPHVDRAFDLMTAVLSAVNQEQRRVVAGTAQKDERSDAFVAGVAVIAGDISRAADRLDTAAQRRAQLTYTTGMLGGAVGMILLCGVLGGVLSATGTPAADGVALLAGAAGAIVSVMQRMTSGTLRLDVHAGHPMLLRFGTLRPVIGAVIGMAVAALFAAGLLPAITIETDQKLAFFASIGFLAGFNERFAQDMLATGRSRIANVPG